MQEKKITLAVQAYVWEEFWKLCIEPEEISNSKNMDKTKGIFVVLIYYSVWYMFHLQTLTKMMQKKKSAEIRKKEKSTTAT